MYEELKSLAQSLPESTLDTAFNALATGFGLRRGPAPAPAAAGDAASSSSGSSSDGKGGGGRGGGRGIQRRKLTSTEITACGALSKMAASIATYPSQVETWWMELANVLVCGCCVGVGVGRWVGGRQMNGWV